MAAKNQMAVASQWLAMVEGCMDNVDNSGLGGGEHEWRWSCRENLEHNQTPSAMALFCQMRQGKVSPRRTLVDSESQRLVYATAGAINDRLDISGIWLWCGGSIGQRFL